MDRVSYQFLFDYFPGLFDDHRQINYQTKANGRARLFGIGRSTFVSTCANSSNDGDGFWFCTN